MIALDAKGLGDVALGREAGILRDPVQDVGLGGKRGHAPSGSMPGRKGHGKAVQRLSEKRRVSVWDPYVDRKSRDTKLGDFALTLHYTFFLSGNKHIDDAAVVTYACIELMSEDFNG